MKIKSTNYAAMKPKLGDKFRPAGAWRERESMDALIADIEDHALSVRGTFNRKEFEYANFGFSVKELGRLVKQLNKLYHK